MNWKDLGKLINQQSYSDYVKAQIYVEVQELLFDLNIEEDLLDRYVDYGFKVWENNDYILPTHIGEAIYFGLNDVDPSNWEDIADVVVKGFELRGESY